MLRVSLSALNAQELRWALEGARRRNNQALADEILAVLEARRMGAAQAAPVARAAERPGAETELPPGPPLELDEPEPDLMPRDAPAPSGGADEAGGYWADLPGGRRYVRSLPAPPLGGFRLSRPHLLRP